MAIPRAATRDQKIMAQRRVAKSEFMIAVFWRGFWFAVSGLGLCFCILRSSLQSGKNIGTRWRIEEFI